MKRRTVSFLQKLKRRYLERKHAERLLRRKARRLSNLEPRPAPLFSARQFLLGASAALAITTTAISVAQSKALYTDVPAAATTDVAFATLTIRATWRIGATFLGNPNARITAIDTSGGIAASRTSGEIPAHVHVSASLIGSTGTYVDTDGNTLSAFTVNTWEDLEYRWDFGDPSGSETFTHPNTGLTVNGNSDQVGPDAVYCYRTTGTKTITLNIRGKTPSGYIAASATMDFDAQAFSYTPTYFDSVNGSTSYDGTAPTHQGGTVGPKGTYADLRAYMISTARQTGGYARLAEGSTFAGASARWEIGALPFGVGIRVDSYVGASGAGADPIVQNTQTPFPGIWRGMTRNCVVSNVEFRDSGDNAAIAFFDDLSLTTSRHNVYYDHVTITSTDGIPFHNVAGSSTEQQGSNPHGSSPNSHNIWNMGFYGGSYTTTGAAAIGIFLSAGHYAFLFGMTIGGGTISDSLNHTVYWNCKEHTCIKWNNFLPAPGGGYNINGNWDVNSGTVDKTCKYFYVAENNLTGCIAGLDINNGAGNADPDFTTVVVEANAIHDTTGGNAIQGNAGTSRTFRRNRFWNIPAGCFVLGGDGDTKYKVYENLSYSAAGSSGGTMGFGSEASFRPQLFTDNVIVSDTNPVGESFNSGFTYMSLDNADFVTRGSFVDRNQYFGRHLGFLIDMFALADPGFKDATPGEWQAAGRDVNGFMHVDPLWTYPVTQWSHFDDVNPITVLRVTDANKDAYRAAIIAELFSGGGLPTAGADSGPVSVTNPLTALGLTATNFASCDKYEFDILKENASLYGTTECWLFKGTVRNNKLVVFPLGHNTHANSPPDGISVNAGRLVRDLVNAHYDVAIFFPHPDLDASGNPNFNGVNPAGAAQGHDDIPDRTPTWNAVGQYFVANAVRVINEFTGYDRYFAVGQSGGGWEVVLLGAIDTRVTAIDSHAGFMPLYISENRDWEQDLQGLRDLSSPGPVDYTDLAALCTTGGRILIQSINDEDNAAFRQESYESGPDYVAAVAAFATSQGGLFDLEIDDNNVHSYLDTRRARIIEIFDNAP